MKCTRLLRHTHFRKTWQSRAAGRQAGRHEHSSPVHSQTSAAAAAAAAAACAAATCLACETHHLRPSPRAVAHRAAHSRTNAINRLNWPRGHCPNQKVASRARLPTKPRPTAWPIRPSALHEGIIPNHISHRPLPPPSPLPLPSACRHSMQLLMQCKACAALPLPRLRLALVLVLQAPGLPPAAPHPHAAPQVASAVVASALMADRECGDARASQRCLRHSTVAYPPRAPRYRTAPSSRASPRGGGGSSVLVLNPPSPPQGWHARVGGGTALRDPPTRPTAKRRQLYKWINRYRVRACERMQTRSEPPAPSSAFIIIRPLP